MSNYVALRGALGTMVFGAQLLWGPATLAARRPERHNPTAREETVSRHAKAPHLEPEMALRALAALEPPPTGDQLVLWALPTRPRLPIKVRSAPKLAAASLGEARGALEVQVLSRSLAKGRGGCREWLAAVPTGFICRSQVTLQAGYASVPPAQESATGWQRYRYGVVTAKAVGLRSGSGKYLRATLQKGDGIMVVREVNGQAQLIDHQWLASKDVELATPPAMLPLRFDALPPGARPAWVVPPPGEALTPVYPPSAEPPAAEPAAALALLPRYSVVLYTDSPANPGRVQVLLTDESRAALKGSPEAQAARAVELDAGVLRRFVPVPPPAAVGPEERWIDISLQEQVATAYLGKTPLFAALVSTGKGSKTPPGSFFVYRKYLTQTMANQRGAAAQYDYREVPHAQFFNGRIGLHAVLWHDSLGNPVSHGCVNLSPAAATQFFSFSAPFLPPGWHSVTAVAPTSPELPETAAGAHGPVGADGARGPEPARPPTLLGTRVIVRR